ncbi:hypothetical protein AB0F77_04505 [Streptomyces sp. NPDC026672]|uniref:hypothetical protein n=1 Tax=unclassified Streptomyces TaxID=2593676 RepID=UPI0033E474D2
MTTAQTVREVRLTTVISRLPGGAADGCRASVPAVPAVPADFLPPVPADGLAVAEPEPEGEAVAVADADAPPLGEAPGDGLELALAAGESGVDRGWAAASRRAAPSPSGPAGDHRP